jgi:hypothetical protein
MTAPLVPTGGSLTAIDSARVSPRHSAAVLAVMTAVSAVACGTGAPPQPPELSVLPAAVGSDCSNLVAQPGVSGDGPAGYTWCAAEGGSCTFSQSVDVAFGANGGFTYKNAVTGTVGFTVASFGADPIVNVVKAGYYRPADGPPGYTKCADEGGTCSFARTVDVAYGAHGLFNYQCGVSGNVAMTNATFGDPIFNAAKAGYVRNAGGPTGYTWCADEGGSCTFSAATDVAYGASGVYTLRAAVTGTIAASNATFGDPIPSVAKSLYYRPTAVRTPPAGYTWCADERGTCAFSRAVDVTYGANGSFRTKYGVSGTVSFENAIFGDPIRNVAKAGYFRTAVAPGSGWTAQWIWQPQDRPQNTWLRFRKTVSLSAKPASASVRIAAENKYWLYINGQLVVPDGGLDLRPDLQNTYYDTLDITPYLTAGNNVIAALVWYKGGAPGYSQIMTSDGGFLFEAALSGATPATVVSDRTWKTSIHPAFTRTAQHVQSADFKWPQYPVIYDARNDPGDWTSVGFDDSGPVWTTATERGLPPSAPWNTLVPRTIPMLKSSPLTAYTNRASLPATVTTNTSFTADIGNNIQTDAYLKVNAPAGVTITIRMNQWYQEQYVTKAGVQEYTTYQWQNTSGRPWSKHSVEYAFTNVTGPVQILDVEYKPLGYNTAFVGSFTSNNARLNTLWNKSRNTSYVCMRDQFYDCPDRERGQWWGDVSEQILYSFYLYDSSASLLAKKAFRELLNTQKPDGSLYTTAPGTVFHLPDQNMAAVNALGHYYLYTGDTALVSELYPRVATYLKQYVASTRNADGMLILQPNVWNWIDWGTNLDIQTGSANTVVNGLFVRLLETGKLLAQASGNTGDISLYQGFENAVTSHFNPYFWSPSANAYVFGLLNGAQSSTIDDRSNAWAVLAGAPDPARLPGVLNVLDTKLNAAPYQERYIEEAMFQMGSDSDAITRMLNYYQMDIDSWSQTMWERSGGGDESNNHAWAAGATYLLGAFVAGVRPTAPGWASYVVAPQLGTLTSVSATVPSVRGSISVSHTLSATSYTLALTSPVGTNAVVSIPKKHAWTTVTANGAIVWNRGTFTNAAGITSAGEDSAYIRFNTAPGTWQFAAQ